jgi:hypothetical protein
MREHCAVVVAVMHLGANLKRESLAFNDRGDSEGQRRSARRCLRFSAAASLDARSFSLS